MKQPLKDTPLIEVSRPTSRFRDVQAAADVDSDVWRGQLLGFRGPNGAGKTMTIVVAVDMDKGGSWRGGTALDRGFIHTINRDRRPIMNLRAQFLLVHPTSAICLLAALGLLGCASPRTDGSEEMVRYGGMHETIGQGRHEGRVALDEILRRPHFYGVGALEGLRGEVTIVNSEAVATGATAAGGTEQLKPSGLEAALLVGQSVPEWTRVEINQDISSERFDEAVMTAATHQGLNPAQPFLFAIEGGFTDVRLHVINGACPIHARMKKLNLRPEEQPFELEAETLYGTVVGVYAPDSVGTLTHPATSTHAHLVYVDPRTGDRLTGHLERIGITQGAILKLPKVGRLPAKVATR